jgi:hypothetical protein
MIFALHLNRMSKLAIGSAECQTAALAKRTVTFPQQSSFAVAESPQMIGYPA